jgi:catechol 2,3-dioxygenase-like lactoylglutathione lyase family enzyme
MQQVVPTFRITDYARSKAFYTDGLGFAVDWEHRFEPGFPVFMQVTREGMALYLSEHEGDCQVGGLVHLYVPDVDAWYEDLRDRDVLVDAPSEDLPGLRGIEVVDPDGNQLRIYTRLN